MHRTQMLPCCILVYAHSCISNIRLRAHVPHGCSNRRSHTAAVTYGLGPGILGVHTRESISNSPTSVSCLGSFEQFFRGYYSLRISVNIGHVGNSGFFGAWSTGIRLGFGINEVLNGNNLISKHQN